MTLLAPTHGIVQRKLKACVGPITRAIAIWVRAHAVDAVTVAPRYAVGTNGRFSNQIFQDPGAPPRAVVGLFHKHDHVQVQRFVLVGLHPDPKCLDVTGILQREVFPGANDIPIGAAVGLPIEGEPMPLVVAFVGKLNAGLRFTPVTAKANFEPAHESV